MQKFMINLPDKDLAYFPERTEHFDDYVEAVEWAQDYARRNRDLMMEQIVTAVRNSGEVPPFSAEVKAINCHHNYVAREKHFGESVLITRTTARIAALEAYDEALRLFGDDALTTSWRNELGRIVDDDLATPSIAGLSLRRLHDVGGLDAARVATEFARHTGPRQPKEAGAFLEGFLRGGSEVLLQDEPLLQLLDAWLCDLSETDFTDSLPLLRRSMSNFDTVARRRLLEAIQRGRRQSTSAAPQLAKESNPAFEAALPLLYKILGLGEPS